MVEASEISVDDISPPSFRVKVLDRNGKPVKEKTFSVSVDGKRERTMDTDGEGRLMIAKPKARIRFTLKTPLEESTESGAGAAGSGKPSA